jgi:2-phosphosulfolactate phosphatase
VPDRPDADIADAHGQAGWEVRFDWGPEALRHVARGAAVVVVVDVLRFTTAVSVAVGRGAEVLPYMWDMGDAARAYADRHGAELAGRWRDGGGWSLSPTDLAKLSPGSRLVLPSPNGSALAFGARDEVPEAAVLAGCLRNAAAVATVAGTAAPGPVAVLAAGERWRGDLGPLRPSVEDLAGAGAVIDSLVAVADRPAAGLSPEAHAARAVFRAARDDLVGWLAGSASGRELVAWGWGDDVETAADLDAEDVAPVLDGPAFRGVAAAPAGHLR